MRMTRRWVRWSTMGAAFLVSSLLSCKEAVMEPLTVASVEVAGGGANVRLGQSVQLTPTLKSVRGLILPTVGVTWNSSDAAKATVSPSGQVTGVARGPVTLTASAGGVNGTAAVTVIGVQSVSLAPDTVSVIVTQSRTLTVTTVLDPGVTVTPTYRSLDTLIARVDAAGRVTATGTTGLARIEVTAEDKRDTAVVRVVPVPVASVVVSPDVVTRSVGQSIQLIATPRDSVGGAIAGRSTVWSSSDTTRAIVSATGTVTMRSVGSVTIAATIDGKVGTAAISILAARTVLPATLAVGTTHACGIAVDSTAYCWGDNTGQGFESGALGDGSTTSKLTPVPVSGGIKFASIYAGVARNFTCGLSVSGEAYCWGANPRGQLGDGTTVTRLSPVRAAPEHKFVMLSLDHLGACGLKADDTVYCWGDNILGQLGDGTRTNRLTPVRLLGVSGIRRIFSGVYVTCVELFTNETKCVGQEFEFADQTRFIWNEPTLVRGGSVTDVSIGTYHLCGKNLSGTFVCWGINSKGELGDGTLTNGREQPAPVLTTATFVTSTNSAQLFHCELTAAGQPYCWGAGFANEFASLPGSPLPAPISGAPPLVSLATGGFACGLDANGSAYCWGRNEFGQLGDGTTITRATAAPVNGGIRFRLP